MAKMSPLFGYAVLSAGKAGNKTHVDFGYTAVLHITNGPWTAVKP